MLAAVLEEPGRIGVREMPVPEPGPEDVLVHVRRASLCGTDVKIRSRAFFSDGGPAAGTFIPGHEYAGVVAAVGAEVDEFCVGDRVVSEAHRGCMRCANCLRGRYTDCLNYGRRDKGQRTQGMTVDGGFAEYALNHVATLTTLPHSVDFDAGVVLSTVGTVMHAFDVLGDLVTGATVVVIGPGPIGLLAVQVAHELAAAKIVLVGTRASRLAAGTRFGADAVVDARQPDAAMLIREELGGRGADIVLECSGAAPAVDLAVHTAKRGGEIVLVGFYATAVTADLNHAVLNGVTLRTVRGEGAGSLARGVALAARGRLDLEALVTHHFRLDEISAAFDTYVERRDDALKVMLDVTENPETDSSTEKLGDGDER
ncbi:alcohol dehydrogenase catalytic domain-containing protein [Nocardia sp. NPDC050697]|uniref:zinc-dependent alcohol dehydrogenase n=1 Tax=Nocardia sp. NPDC050697 TaxID=3155158 RepID=UPI0033DE1E99